MRPLRELFEFRTLDEAAQLCKRRPKTIINLLSEHQLPRRLGWIVKNRRRRRVVLLSPRVVEELQNLTLFGPTYRERARAAASSSAQAGQ